MRLSVRDGDTKVFKTGYSKGLRASTLRSQLNLNFRVCPDVAADLNLCATFVKVPNARVLSKIQHARVLSMRFCASFVKVPNARVLSVVDGK